MLWSSLGGGFIGTLVLTTLMRGAGELGLTRMDMPFLLGTVVTENRRKAKALGYALHFGIGFLIALMYGAVFAAVGRRSWWLGALFGLVHALFVGTVAGSILLPAVHPRIGTPESAAHETALIEAPGFMFLNYGRNTVLVSLVSHIAYGAIIGWAVSGP